MYRGPPLWKVSPSHMQPSLRKIVLPWKTHQGKTLSNQNTKKMGCTVQYRICPGNKTVKHWTTQLYFRVALKEQQNRDTAAVPRGRRQAILAAQEVIPHLRPPRRSGAREELHTESSYKYHPAEFEGLAHRGGFAVSGSWTDENGLFSGSPQNR